MTPEQYATFQAVFRQVEQAGQDALADYEFALAEAGANSPEAKLLEENVRFLGALGYGLAHFAAWSFARPLPGQTPAAEHVH